MTGLSNKKNSFITEKMIENDLFVFLFSSNRDDIPKGLVEQQCFCYIIIDYIKQSRYPFPRRLGSAGRLSSDTMQQIHHFPDSAFICNFRMSRVNAWHLVVLVETRTNQF